jgi:hypothetical protein
MVLSLRKPKLYYLKFISDSWYSCVEYCLIWKIPGTDKFAKVIDFLCRQLHRETLVNDFCCCFLVFVISFGPQNNLLFIIL